MSELQVALGSGACFKNHSFLLSPRWPLENSCFGAQKPVSDVRISVWTLKTRFYRSGTPKLEFGAQNSLSEAKSRSETLNFVFRRRKHLISSSRRRIPCLFKTWNSLDTQSQQKLFSCFYCDLSIVNAVSFQDRH